MGNHTLELEVGTLGFLNRDNVAVVSLLPRVHGGYTFPGVRCCYAAAFLGTVAAAAKLCDEILHLQ